MSMMGDYTIRISALENAFTVEVPDAEMIKKKQAEQKKDKGNYPMYIGDCTKKYAAKSVPEVMKLVKTALADLPELAFAESFAEASKGVKGE